MRHSPSFRTRTAIRTRTIALALAVTASAVLPVVAPAPVEAAPIAPPTFDLFRPEVYRYQDPNYAACTSTSAMIMLNSVALAGSGGSGFRWTVSRSGTLRDGMLAWQRTHDTLAGGTGSDPHGWRNALNYYGWGSTRLWAGKRVYEDKAYRTYEGAMRAAVRALIAYRKPVGLLAWGGRHAQVLTGYDGLVGDPFAKDANGEYLNDFRVEAYFLSDPLKSQAMVHARIRHADLKASPDPKLRFTAYLETDSPYDDPYTPGWRRSRTEWYGFWVIIVPVR